MLNLEFLEKGLEIVSSPHFVHDLSRKCYTLLTDQISLSDFLYFLNVGQYPHCNS